MLSSSRGRRGVYLAKEWWIGIPAKQWDEFADWMTSLREHHPLEAAKIKVVGGPPYAWMRVQTTDDDHAVFMKMRFAGRTSYRER